MVTIDPAINISELALKYPEVVDFLIYEYGFHCIGCFVSEFESLEEGASVHGIVGEDFDNMMKQIEDIINKKDQKSDSSLSS